MALAYLRHNVCVIVLAGGQSSRMGQDKALLEIKGIPLLQKVGEVAWACSDRVYIVTGWPQRYQHLPIATHCQFLKEPNAQGPLISFRDSLSHLVNLGSPKPFWVMLLACDLPNLQANVLHDWITQLTYLPDTVMAYLPKHAAIANNKSNSNKQWEPLCGLYRSDCLLNLQKFSASGGRSFQQWLTQIQVAEITSVDSRILFNCNTPTDFDMVI
jgi:molybdopterin-guanine dinucleotide biosynthesis protein A